MPGRSARRKTCPCILHNLLLLGELVLEGEQPEQLAARAVLKHEVELLLVLEGLPEFDEEGVIE